MRFLWAGGPGRHPGRGGGQSRDGARTVGEGGCRGHRLWDQSRPRSNRSIHLSVNQLWGWFLFDLWPLKQTRRRPAVNGWSETFTIPQPIREQDSSHLFQEGWGQWRWPCWWRSVFFFLLLFHWDEQLSNPVYRNHRTGSMRFCIRFCWWCVSEHGPERSAFPAEEPSQVKCWQRAGESDPFPVCSCSRILQEHQWNVLNVLYN